METEVNKSQLAALGIGIVFGGLMACMLTSLGLPRGPLILSIGLLMGPISLIIASVVALFHPRIGGWWLIITGFTTGALFYFGDPYDEIFVYSLWCMPQIAAGVLWLRSGMSLSRVIGKQLGQEGKKHLLMQIGSIAGLLLIVIAFFTPYISATLTRDLGGGWIHKADHDQWSALDIARGADLHLINMNELFRNFGILPCLRREPCNSAFVSISVGTQAFTLSFFLILAGMMGVFLRRLRRLIILIPVGSIIIISFVGITGFLLSIKALEYGVYSLYSSKSAVYIAYSPGIGLILIFIGALLLLIVYAKWRDFTNERGED